MKSTNAADLVAGMKQWGLGLTPTEVHSVLTAALVRGGTLAELFFERTESTRVLYEGGRVDKILEGTDQGCGVRILADGRSVYGYSTAVDAESLLRLAGELAAAVTAGAGAGPGRVASEWRFSRQPNAEIAQYKIERDPRALALAEKIAFTKRAEAAARETLPAARQISAIWLDTRREILVLNSDGVVAPDRKQYLQMVVQVVGAEGEGASARVESAHESDGGYVGLEFFDQNPPEKLGREAATRVRTLLSAKPAPAGTLPVVLAAEAGGTMIHEAVGHGLEADLACNGLSVYQGKVGKQVASPLITVVDDGTMTTRRGSYAFDDEGTASQKTTLIENGVLKGYLVDKISALKFDLMATGNGRRESFRHVPIVRMTNTYIAPGPHDPAEILASTPYGVYVKAMGGGQVNTVTGDFVFAVTEGYLIRDGKIAEPIRGATLVGNGPAVLQSVDRVGTDLGFATGTCGKDGQGAPVTDAQPTLRIPQLAVGGEVPVATYWHDVK